MFQIFNLPLALAIPPSVFMVHSQLNLLYQFWIHTQVSSLIYFFFSALLWCRQMLPALSWRRKRRRKEAYKTVKSTTKLSLNVVPTRSLNYAAKYRVKLETFYAKKRFQNKMACGQGFFLSLTGTLNAFRISKYIQSVKISFHWSHYMNINRIFNCQSFYGNGS